MLTFTSLKLNLMLFFISCKKLMVFTNVDNLLRVNVRMYLNVPELHEMCEAQWGQHMIDQ